jgi:hypothetical protein
MGRAPMNAVAPMSATDQSRLDSPLDVPGFTSGSWFLVARYLLGFRDKSSIDLTPAVITYRFLNRGGGGGLCWQQPVSWVYQSGRLPGSRHR